MKKRGELCGEEDCEHCFERSFASCEKSKCLVEGQGCALLITKRGTKKLSFICPLCEHRFEAVAAKVSEGQWCPFCASRQLCSSSECDNCFKKSFAFHTKAKFWSSRNKKTARQTFLGSQNKAWFDCDACGHVFEAVVYNILGRKWCPYCGSRKLCDSPDCETCFKNSFASHPKEKYWSDKNEKTASETFLHSGRKAWFNCEKKHEFKATVDHVSKGTWCPKCKNKTESLVFEFLKENFENPKHQFKVSWCKNPKTGKFLPFDFCVSKTIIEMDGRQHYEQVMNWKTPEETQKNDRYKEECAVKNGYSIIRILQEDVWNDKMDWKKLLLEHVKDYETPAVIRLFR